ncbi:hypothetical protein KY348_00250 [Candidatus Woesearchaeota archaeon]|nr:hypothetical protein [Candidatus Woesearchaeota archaeon]
MRLKSNVRADILANTVLWFGILIAAMICMAWLVKNLRSPYLPTKELDNELDQLQLDLNKACTMDYFWKRYYPKVNKGKLIFNDFQVCMNAGECKVLFFKPTMPNASGHLLEGKDILLPNATECENIELCQALFFTSDNEPPLIDYIDDAQGSRIRINNANVCELKPKPITRCRLLTCSLNITEHFSLDKIVYLNITRDKSGVFSVQPKES